MLCAPVAAHYNGISNMRKIKDIKNAILALSESEYIELRQWFSELDWKKWDRQIEADTEAGKLDFLISKALEEKEKGRLVEL